MNDYVQWLYLIQSLEHDLEEHLQLVNFNILFSVSSAFRETKGNSGKPVQCVKFPGLAGIDASEPLALAGLPVPD